MSKLSQQSKDDAVLRDEFEIALLALLFEYSMSPRDVVSILNPEAIAKIIPGAKEPSRVARTLKGYKIPRRGEIIETEGGATQC